MKKYTVAAQRRAGLHRGLVAATCLVAMVPPVLADVGQAGGVDPGFLSGPIVNLPSVVIDVGFRNFTDGFFDWSMVAVRNGGRLTAGGVRL